MADAKEKQSKADATDASHRKGLPLKMLIVVAGLMIGEAAGVYVLVGMSGSRAEPAAAEIHGAEQADLAQSVEIELIDEKFQNMQTGRVWIWDTQIVLKARKKNQEFIETELENRNAEIMEGVAQIMRRAQHSHLREAELTTINRQLTAYLDKCLGPDADGHTRIERVLIPKCRGYQVEQ
jgi:flagellar basal body-associated protein FliL